MKNIKVSIIVPTYNVEKYLADCLESLISQSLKEKEIIIVNDGSKDRSLEIANEYASKHNEIKVYTKKNGGLSSARNYGLEVSNGEYIIFIDSDDMIIDKKTIENFYLLALENKCDIVKGKYLILNEKTGEKIKGTDFREFSLVNKCVEAKEYFNCCIEEQKYEVTAILGIYKKSLLKEYNINFIDKVKMEDHDFNLKVLLKTNAKVIQTNSEFYLYRKREGSITTVPKKDGIDDILKIAKELMSFINSIKLDDRTNKNARKAISTLIYQATSIYGRISKEDQRLLDEYIDNKIIKFSFCNAIDFHQKIKLFIFLYFRSFLKLIYIYKLSKVK